MPSESVKVMVRVRPMNKKEQERGCKSIIQVDQKLNSICLLQTDSNESQKVFSFDNVFPVEELQQNIYELSAFSLVENVVEGYNGTIFAYGQTGCGKTFTMLGDPNSETYKGIIPRTFSHIVNVVQASTDKKFLLRCSYIEIYNEEIRDLLGKDNKAKLDLKESPDKGVFIKDLNQVIVKSAEEMDRYMSVGTAARSVAETNMNSTSSRSHCIFSLYIECSCNDEKGNERFTAGKLNLVDLAGSERQSKTGATGDRLKEATKINLSLSALGNVISALVDGKSQHIPYRDSKLTRLLQDSLGGNTKTIMIAAVSPADYNYDETLSTLRYASRAKNIKNQPKVNEDPKDALLKEYAEEIKKLKELLQRQQAGEQLQVSDMPQQLQKQATMDLMESRHNFSQQQMEGGGGNFQNNGNGNGNQSEAQMMMMNNNNQNSQNGGVTHSQELTQLKIQMENELKQKELAILNEKLEKEKIENLMKDLQQKFITGGTGDEQQKKKYDNIKQKLKKQQREHDKLLEDNRKKEEEMLDMQHQYNSLQEEVEEMRKIMKELQKKYKSAQEEIKDLEREHEFNRQDLLDTIRLQEKDFKLYLGMCRILLTEQEIEIIKGASDWNEDKKEFRIPPFYFKEKQVKFPKMNMGQQNAMNIVEKEKENRDLDFKTQRLSNNNQQSQNQQQQQQQQGQVPLMPKHKIQQHQQQKVECDDEYSESLDHMDDLQPNMRKTGNKFMIRQTNNAKQQKYVSQSVDNSMQMNSAIREASDARIQELKIINQTKQKGNNITQPQKQPEEKQKIPNVQLEPIQLNSDQVKSQKALLNSSNNNTNGIFQDKGKVPKTTSMVQLQPLNINPPKIIDSNNIFAETPTDQTKKQQNNKNVKLESIPNQSSIIRKNSVKTQHPFTHLAKPGQLEPISPSPGQQNALLQHN